MTDELPLSLPDRLLVIAKKLDVGSKAAISQANVHIAHGEKDDATKQIRRAESGKDAASDCREASETIKNLIKEIDGLKKRLETNRKRSAFIPPSVDEVKAYMRHIGLPPYEAEAFIAYYNSNGWMVGKNKMVSWEDACVTWKKHHYKQNPGARAAASNGDPDGWAEFLKSEHEPYKEYRFAPSFLKDKFIASKRK